MIHIVAFDVPFPPDYGGAIDVFYKIKALHATGVKITLHCFTYRDRQAQSVLETFCEKVFYYKRRTGFFSHLSKMPYIVKSRKHPDLLKNLCADNTPILFEGLHTCAFIDHPSLEQRKKMVRMHNIEWQYYEHLALAEKKIFSKKYFQIEGTKLKRFEEKVFFHGDIFFCISRTEEKYFFEKNIFFSEISKKYLEKNIQKKVFEKKIIFLPPFHAEEKVISKVGIGDYILYHGDLSVNDNVESVKALIENVFSKINVRCIVAGKNPSRNLIGITEFFPNIKIIVNPKEQDMKNLIQNAQINILHTGHTSGMKLKLLHALFVGRFCFANTEMVQDTGLESLCEIYDSFDELKKMISETMDKTFEEKIISKRKKILEKKFSNSFNASKILRSI